MITKGGFFFTIKSRLQAFAINVGKHDDGDLVKVITLPRSQSGNVEIWVEGRKNIACCGLWLSLMAYFVSLSSKVRLYFLREKEISA